MPRRKKDAQGAAPQTQPARQTPAASANGNGTESVAGYFRKVFEENPRLLNERSNDKLYERWLADHPGHTKVPEKVRANLQNLKSVLRKLKGKRKPEREAAASPQAEAAPVKQERQRPARRSQDALEALEGMIDECLFASRQLEAEGLERATTLLRQARNEVIRQAGVEA
jgi:hypothetical protein